MANDNNGIMDRLDAVIVDPDTPEWARPVLLYIRDDHQKLARHLSVHKSWLEPARQIGVTIITTVAVAVVVWLLAGRFSAIFLH